MTAHFGWWISRYAVAKRPDANRGAAYNSLSVNAGVDCVALFSGAELEVFVSGARVPFDRLPHPLHAFVTFRLPLRPEPAHAFQEINVALHRP
jgi:hypothetical protein